MGSLLGAGSTVRRHLGPWVRRTRREWQWWQHRDALRLARESSEGYPEVVAEHATPLFRGLSGVDHSMEVSKTHNLGLAIAELDALVLRPGARLSFWRQVGRPTARRGFRPGLLLTDGRLEMGVGGGLCQLTNLLYWMTLHTPLTVVERWRHTYDVFADSGRTQPFGSGATCSFPLLDLQVVNETNAPYRLGLRLDTTHLRGEWRSTLPRAVTYEVYEAAHVVTHDLPGVYTRRNQLRRRTLAADGGLIADELVCENHARMRYSPELPS